MTSYGIEHNEAVFLENQPTGRLGSVQDMAGLSLFLSTKASAHITGAFEGFLFWMVMGSDRFLAGLQELSSELMEPLLLEPAKVAEVRPSCKVFANVIGEDYYKARPNGPQPSFPT